MIRSSQSSNLYNTTFFVISLLQIKYEQQDDVGGSALNSFFRETTAFVNFSWGACVLWYQSCILLPRFYTSNQKFLFRNKTMFYYLYKFLLCWQQNSDEKCARAKRGKRECVHHFYICSMQKKFLQRMRIQRTPSMFCLPSRRHVWNYWFLTYSCVFSRQNASHPPFTYISLRYFLFVNKICLCFHLVPSSKTKTYGLIRKMKSKITFTVWIYIYIYIYTVSKISIVK